VDTDSVSTYPVLAAAVPDSVATEARALIEAIRHADDPLLYRKQGAETVVRLTEVGLEAFFLAPVEQLGLGPVAASMVRLGLRTAGGAIAVFIRRIVAGLDAEQIRAVAELVDARLLDLSVDDEEA
jgi:hypothetical protein